MKKLLLILTIIFSSCSPLIKMNTTGISLIREFDYTPFYENGIKIFNQNYDYEKYYQVGKYEISNISNTKMINLYEEIPEEYFVSYKLSSVRICQEKLFIVKNRIYNDIIRLTKDKGDAILDIRIKQSPSLVYKYNGTNLYSDEIIFEFVILKSIK